jgi:hypothetical protein
MLQVECQSIQIARNPPRRVVASAVLSTASIFRKCGKFKDTHVRHFRAQPQIESELMHGEEVVPQGSPGCTRGTETKQNDPKKGVATLKKRSLTLNGATLDAV